MAIRGSRQITGSTQEELMVGLHSGGAGILALLFWGFFDGLILGLQSPFCAGSALLPSVAWKSHPRCVTAEAAPSCSGGSKKEAILANAIQRVLSSQGTGRTCQAEKATSCAQRLFDFFPQSPLPHGCRHHCFARGLQARAPPGVCASRFLSPVMFASSHK